MKVTLVRDDGHERRVGCVNPERVDGAHHADGGGTILSIGPEEVHVDEPFELVRDELEEAWEVRRRSHAIDELLAPLAPLAAILPMVVPMAVHEVMKRAQRTVPESPAPAAPAGVDDDARDEDPRAGPLDAVPPLEPVACKNCGRSSAPQRLCPGCGAVLVGEG